MRQVTDQQILEWLDERPINEKRQVADPDYLPYDRREGF
jgi:hypothetical protein